MSKAKKYLYRKLPHFIKNATGNDWQKCSEADKQKINTMFPGAYEFKKIEALAEKECLDFFRSAF